MVFFTIYTFPLFVLQIYTLTLKTDWIRIGNRLVITFPNEEIFNIH
ncbi:MAG: hypothetical protein KatS3mg045_1351 [Bellilinea sp.]|nr:MAG: hypothetical protein KatS3mg045_1351 [Bellilinea sp.]